MKHRLDARNSVDHEETLEKLTASEIKYRALFDNANDGIFLMKVDTFVDCNPKFLEIFGCTRDQIMGQTPFRFSPPLQPDGNPSKEKAIEKGKLAMRGTPQSFEWKHCRYDGTLFDAEVSLNRIEIDKETRLLQAIVRDVTRRKEAETKLRISEEKYRSIFENAIEGIFQSTPDGRFITANPALARMHGYDSAQEMISTIRNIGEELYVNPDDRIRFKDLLETYGFVEGFEVQVKKRGGDTVWMAINARAIKGDDGRTAHYEGAMEDISRRKAVENALRSSEARYRTFVDSTSDGVFLKDSRFRYVIVNRRFRRFFRKSENDIIGKTDTALRPPEDAKKAKEADTKSLKSTSIVISEETIGDRIYETRRFAVNLAENTRGVGGFVRDITEQKKAEEELKAKSLNLQEVNAALRVLLKQREEDKNEMEEKILANVKRLVLPYLERLKERRLDQEQTGYLAILQTNLEHIISPFLQKMTALYSTFTPTEIMVADLIREGKSVKEIARISGVSTNAVNRHRQNIRNKLGFNKKKINLKTHLSLLA